MGLRPDRLRGAAGRTPHAARARGAYGAAGRGRTGAASARLIRERAALRGRDYRRHAQRRLRSFRQGSLLAVALTGALLALWDAPEATGQETAPPDAAAQQAAPEEEATNGQAPAPLELPGTTEPGAGEPAAAPAGADTAPESPEEAAREATGTIRDLVVGFYALLPKLAIAIGILLIAGLITHFARPLMRRLLGSWERGEATSALIGVLIWLLALGTAFSVIAGDARALLGLVGLFGLALSWALQTPIESFTGWLLNSFKSYYRIGDRIAVGEVFGDVYNIDFLTTTVWEAGGPDKPVTGEQATGALITFPNSEVLRTNIINFTRDFPFVWDEITINIADESDLAYTARVFEDVARRVLGPAMAERARNYLALLERAGLAYDIAVEPRAFFAMTEAFTNVTVRYLIPARERRHWSSTLTMALAAELTRPEHQGRIVSGFPRMQVQISGKPWEAAPGREQS